MGTMREPTRPDDDTTGPELSVVIPVYNGSLTIESVVDDVHAWLEGQSIEVVLVNDGSTDRSEEICEKLVERYPRTVCVLQLSRNFGEHNAVLAGLKYAAGRYVAVLDDDGQNAPSDVLRMLDGAREDGLDVVYARYVNRKHPRHRVLGSWVNDKVANVLLKKPRTLYLSSFKLMSRFVVDQVVRYAGPYPYIDALILRITRNVGQIDVEHRPRRGGQSGYTLAKLVGLWLNMCMGYSIMPLRIALLMGIATATLGFFALAALLIARLWIGPEVTIGTGCIVAAIVLAAGVQLTFLGAVGEYVGRIFLHQSGLPPYVVRRVHTGRMHSAESAAASEDEPALASRTA